MTIQKRMLPHPQFFRLCEWLKIADLKGCHTKAETARRAGASLGFEVSDFSVSTAMQATGVVLETAPLAPSQRRDRSAIVARALVDFMKELGKEPPLDLVQVATGQSITE